jgi:hypothetical protein
LFLTSDGINVYGKLLAGSALLYRRALAVFPLQRIAVQGVFPAVGPLGRPARLLISSRCRWKRSREGIAGHIETGMLSGD